MTISCVAGTKSRLCLRLLPLRLRSGLKAFSARNNNSAQQNESTETVEVSSKFRRSLTELLPKSANHLLQIQSGSYERYVALTGTLHCYVVNIMKAVTTPNSVAMHLLPEQ